MNIEKIVDDKKKWHEHVKRVKALPEDYQIVYKEMQKYLFKVGPVELSENISLLDNIVTFFEEGVMEGKNVLEVTGKDVAAFCDSLIAGAQTYTEASQKIANEKIYETMQKKKAKKLK